MPVSNRSIEIFDNLMYLNYELYVYPVACDLAPLTLTVFNIMRNSLSKWNRKAKHSNTSPLLQFKEISSTKEKLDIE